MNRHLLDAMATAATTTMPPEMTDAQRLELQKALADALTKYLGLLLVLAVGFGIIFLLSLALVIYMRHNRSGAFRGDANAARKIILPAYLPLLLLLMAVSLLYSIYFCILRIHSTSIDQVSTVVEQEVYFSGRVFFILLIVVYMYQKSVTTPALRRAAMVALFLSTYNIPIVWLAETYLQDKELAYWIPQCSRILLVFFFLYVLIIPPERASKKSLREYCVFVLIYYALYFAYSDCFRREKFDTGFLLAYANILWGSLCPLVIWRVLKADTEHWRGLGRRAVALQSLFRQKHRMNERLSSRGLHVLIEMHRKYIIDFAYLELKHKIGMGASAVVFNGVLHNKTPVAVKVYSPTELTDEVVAEFSHEAALCGALHHPNIVKFYGMCVCPPTICLVSELCLGSLDVVTMAIARRPHDITRQQLMVDLNYMIDATRAVAYLHSFSPAFLHRDIKPSNFLVDGKCVVKLTDFGESRSLPRECIASSTTAASSSSMAAVASTSTGINTNAAATVVITETEPSIGLEPTSILTRLSADGWADPLFTTSATTTTRRRAMTVRGTVEYMAPELIQGKAGTALYGEAADIFSLAMTLWDIAYPLGEKYPHTSGNHLKVFGAVLAGERPLCTEGFHPELRELLTRAWDPQPERRPSALAILNALEHIQREVCCDIATVLSSAMDETVLISKKGCTTEPTSASGHDLVQKMLSLDFVGSVEEAVRAGNGLMSCGLLHHARHLVGFENSSEQFLFDESLLDTVHRQVERLYLPRIVERRGSRSDSRSRAGSAASGVAVGSERKTSRADAQEENHHERASSSDGDDHDDDDDDDDDSESVFSRSLGLPATTTRSKAKSDENRDAELASVASAIGSTVSELLRFGSRRKLSRTGSSTHGGNGGEEPRDTSTSHATSSQWANTTNAEPGICPCRKLGAGMMYIAKGHGGSGAGAGGGSRGRRFLRGKRVAGDDTGHFGMSTGGDGHGSSLLSRTARWLHSENGLTAKLLTNEFANTGDSASSEPYDDDDAANVVFTRTPFSSGDVEMGFHVVTTESTERRRTVSSGGGTSRTQQNQIDSHDSSGMRRDGSSTSISSSVDSPMVHAVDLA